MRLTKRYCQSKDSPPHHEFDRTILPKRWIFRPIIIVEQHARGLNDKDDDGLDRRYHKMQVSVRHGCCKDDPNTQSSSTNTGEQACPPRLPTKQIIAAEVEGDDGRRYPQNNDANCQGLVERQSLRSDTANEREGGVKLSDPRWFRASLGIGWERVIEAEQIQ